MLLKNFASYLREKTGDPSLHIVNRNDTIGEESSTPLSAADPKISPAKLVEGSSLTAIRIGNPSKTRFTHFLDGIQRTHLACYWSMVPVLYGYTAAVIRERDSNRKMRSWRSLPNESLFFPFEQIDPSEMKVRGLNVVDTSDGDEQNQEHPIGMLDKARKSINRVRSKLESQLAKEWIESYISSAGNWLLIDGSLTEVIDSSATANVIGIIKSHQTQYFTLEDQKKILNLPAGQRSSVFEIPGRKRMGAYSWYLRLHPNAGRDIYFGLIRIEASPRPETITMADEISRWLLAERSPLSLPDSRWDRLIYPIRDCEEYMRSIAPTKTAMEAQFSGI